MTSLAQDYYFSLPEEEKYKLADIFMHLTGKDFVGKEVKQAIDSLDFHQLHVLQNIIEQQYKFTRH